MTIQNNNATLVDEIIENTSTLPIQCQDWILEVTKAMLFTKKRLSVQCEKADDRKAGQADLSAAESE